MLNYQSQQYKVLPAVASAYAFLMTYRRLRKYYESVYADVMAGNASHLAEVRYVVPFVECLTCSVCDWSSVFCLLPESASR